MSFWALALVRAPRKDGQLVYQSGPLYCHGHFLTSCGFIGFYASDVDRVRPSTSRLERMTSFVDIGIWLGQVVPSDVLERLSLDIIRYSPREEIVYFQACHSFAAVENLRVQMPNLKALSLSGVPLYATSLAPDPQDGSDVQEIPPSLEHLFLEWFIVNGYDWASFVAFLFRHASPGSLLNSLQIGGPCHMCLKVSESIRSMIWRLTMDARTHLVQWLEKVLHTSIITQYFLSNNDLELVCME